MIWFIVGLIVGGLLGAAGVWMSLNRRYSAEKQAWEAAQKQALEIAQQQMKESFAMLAGEALDANSKRLGERAGELLDGKKALIDQTVAIANEQLEKVRKYLQQVEADRKQDFGTLSGSVASLATTTGELHKVLASTQRRGAWGERMAEDVLRLVGMQEKVNYTKQSSSEAASGRPDFTFFLPNDLKVNMDVKFPLERYKAYLDAETEDAQATEAKQLVAAVRKHISDVAKRGYIDPAAPTVPYVIVFLASEQIYSLVLSLERDLIDEAMKSQVVLASPITLYAMLSVMHQAAQNANVTRTAGEVVKWLSEFNQQWKKYNEEMDKLGKQIDTVKTQFDTVRGTRSNVLQKPLDKIEQIRSSHELPEA